LHDNHHQQAQALPMRVVSAFRNDPINSIANHKPKYDNYLSAVVAERDHKSDGDFKYMFDLLDDFRYSIGDERLSATSNAGNKWWSIGIKNRQHVTISNYVRAMKSFNYNTSVTLVTQLELDSQPFHHTLELCERWDGPMSVSIFLARGLNELPVAMSLIKFVRQCLPAPLSGCMRDKVTWHLVFTSSKPDINDLSSALTYPKYHLDTINYSSFANTDQCPKFNDSSAFELIKRFQNDILAKNNKSVISLAGGEAGRRAETPVNVLRNVARNTAKTKYVLVTNVDLYPSVHLAGNFNELINGNNGTISSHRLANVERCIFPLPAFEMHKSDELNTQQQIPKTKRDLVELVSNGRVGPYREPDCIWCHEFPDEHNWLSSIVDDQKDELTVFKTAAWTHSGARGWSPFFLAQNSYPNYNEDLMTNERVDLMYEICLKDYSMIVLNNGFLIRSEDSNEMPGLTRKHVRVQEQVHSVEKALSNLTLSYKDNANIKKC
jgi:N-acetyllactosaminide beta-1,3-N-acetylglucosaminyltransferase